MTLYLCIHYIYRIHDSLELEIFGASAKQFLIDISLLKMTGNLFELVLVR